jgi:hypothetical protein
MTSAEERPQELASLDFKATAKGFKLIPMTEASETKARPPHPVF